MRYVNVHCCFLDETCRSAIGGGAARVHLTVGRWHLGVAFTPASRFMTRRRSAPPYERGEGWHLEYYRAAWTSLHRTPKKQAEGEDTYPL